MHLRFITSPRRFRDSPIPQSGMTSIGRATPSPFEISPLRSSSPKLPRRAASPCLTTFLEDWSTSVATPKSRSARFKEDSKSCLLSRLVAIIVFATHRHSQRSQKLSTRRVQIEHVLYTEDYVEKNAPDFTAETRYLANIDQKLVSSTLFDRVRVRNLENSYKTLYREGVSIRLCYWDTKRQYWVSLLGPKVPSRSGKKYRLGNRPSISMRAAPNFSRVIGRPLLSLQHQETDTKVQAWIETVLDHMSFSVPPAELKHGDSSTSSFPNVQAADRKSRLAPASATTAKDLMNCYDEQIADLNNNTPRGSRPTAAEPVDKAAAIDKITRQLVSLLMPLFPELSTDCMSPSSTHAGTMAKAESREGTPSRFQAQDTEALIDLQDTAGIENPQSASNTQISWEMPALIPQSVSAIQSRDAQLFRKHLESGNDNFRPMNKQTAPRQAGIPSASGQITSQLELEEPDRLFVTEKFVEELEAAMVRLLMTGPYRRGKVELRAELGRVLLMGLDLSALAFNDINTPSNGWQKAKLLEQLGVYFSQPQNIHFTKILTTYASDTEDMININTGGTRLWKENPGRAWTVYSFRCALRLQNTPVQYVVDIEDDPLSSDPLSYSIRPYHSVDGMDGLLPIYVHAIRRNWDLEIRLSHTRTGSVEKALGSYAKTLLHTLSVS